MSKRFAYVTLTVIILIFLDKRFNVRCCKDDFGNRATISTITTGTFSETIPQRGKITEDGAVSVDIDQLNFTQIKKGLRATATINDADVLLEVSKIDTVITEGKFLILMNFTDTVMTLPHEMPVRLRIELSQPREGILLPVGGFYRDTHGEWIYVATDGEYFEKRSIKIGAKNPEHFLVLEGLQPGEKVLTSTYENFANKDRVSLWEIEKRKPLSLM